MSADMETFKSYLVGSAVDAERKMLTATLEMKEFAGTVRFLGAMRDFEYWRERHAFLCGVKDEVHAFHAWGGAQS